MKANTSRSLWDLELCTRVPVTLGAAGCAIMHRVREGDVRSVRCRDTDLLARLEICAAVDDRCTNAVWEQISLVFEKIHARKTY